MEAFRISEVQFAAAGDEAGHENPAPTDKALPWFG